MRILATVEHPFVSRLVRTFQDEQRLYLLMEPILGGELYVLLHVLGRMVEPSVCFYLAIVLEVMCHLHERHVVYRDLKPENLLLDEHGYLKLVDFGLAKHLPPRVDGGGASLTRTICGTPEYLAPEVLRGEAYGLSRDPSHALRRIAASCCVASLRRAASHRCVVLCGIAASCVASCCVASLHRAASHRCFVRHIVLCRIAASCMSR